MKFRKLLPGVLSAAIVAGLGLASLSVQAQDGSATQALNYVKQNKQQFGLTGSDIGELEVLSVIPAGDNGISHVYLQQRFRGIEVAYGVFTVNLTADGKVLNPGHRFIDHIAAKAGNQNARKTSVTAVEAAAQYVGLKASRSFEIIKKQGGPNEKAVLTDGGVAAAPIEVKLIWYPTDDGALRLSWVADIEASDGQDHWLVYVDATTGKALGSDNLVTHDSGEAIAASIARPAAAGASTLATLPKVAAFPVTDGATYFVYPIPMESPTDGPQTLVTNAADPAASPLGWHDDGTVQYTITRGNNVHAYADVDANNQPDAGSEPDGGAALVFDDVHDQAAQPAASLPAAITNLFYWNNVVHDVTYNHGFDEASGNFQTDNFGLGGAGADYVRAEAQDGSGTDNANFGTPSDGNRPRMQMYRWLSPFAQLATVNAPASIAGVYVANPSVNGGTANGLTADLALVDDGVGPTDDSCQPSLVDLTGKIALIRWSSGICNSSVFVNNAVNAGAVAAIIIDVTDIPYTNFGGSTVIPSVSVGQAHGNLFDGALLDGETVNITIDDNPDSVDRDSDFDAGIIAHEYGHGVSNRLTGGRLTASCLGNAEQMGEGWSDWLGMTLTTSPSDTAATVRGVGTYSIFQGEDGNGIRPTPYTTDMSINPSTYAWVADPSISQPHGIGYVWNSMLWEMYWNLVHKHGYNPDVYQSWETGGNNLAQRLVLDGMKFQPCRPGFVDGRDAILAADVALTGGSNQCEIWRGFVKRGLGANAVQGSSANRNDGVENFEFPAQCMAAEFGDFQKPVSAAPKLNAWDAGDVIPVKFSLTGDTTSMSIDTQPIDCTTLEPTGEAPIEVASPGTTSLKATGSSFSLNWQTDAGWVGSCRSLTVRIPAEVDAVAHFRFE